MPLKPLELREMTPEEKPAGVQPGGPDRPFGDRDEITAKEWRLDPRRNGCGLSIAFQKVRMVWR
jgi:hypothetical protein